MPNMPAKWRKYLYGISIALIPVLGVLGWVSDELVPLLLSLANAVFVGGLALANVTPDPDGDETQESAE